MIRESPKELDGVTEEQFDQWVVQCNAEVQTCLEDCLRTEDGFVEMVARHLVDAGGKRYRPGLTIAAAGLGPKVDQERLIRAATMVELTHVASLYHDDVMDEAEMRRGKPSAHVMWGNSVAILVGDFMLARASILGASLGEDCIAYQAHTLARLVQGQIAESRDPDPGMDPIAHHLSVVSGKTAALIATAVRFGAIFGGLGASEVEALTAFGEELGMAFQLADDLMDLLSEESGKPLGTDLREGVPTLTTLLIQDHPRDQDARLIELLSAPVADADIPEALALIRAHPVLDQARAMIRTIADQALAHLEIFSDSPAKRALATLCTQAADRTT